METLQQILEKARLASYDLNLLETARLDAVLHAVADATEENMQFILSENRKDLDKMDPTNPKYDRLQLTENRVREIAKGIREVAALPSPLNLILEERVRPNGLKLQKISVPFGVIGIIYEARPNVSLDVFSLCFKSGNVCLLKGGSDAACSNRAIVDIIRGVLLKQGLNPDFVTLLPNEREATTELLNAVGYVDLIIPRGSSGLINFVRANAKVPVIETGAGICHTYFDEFGDKEKAERIVFNAKTRRVSVCNALDCLIVHEQRLSDLAFVCQRLADKKVIIYADAKSYSFLLGKYPSELLQKATNESFGTEFLDYKMSVKTVETIQQAIAHITKYSSKHSEAIISENAANVAYFQKVVDAACVYANASTAFTDGGQFGLGAEIGISTQKMHARGPMALREITSYKWLISGNGQVRE
ncbi:MAG: glutamate-5-semialdehyde dehydrogenase [Paludibacteraceae bacterium]|nr:glutamate-5-semialdehyde dehydrogenase [Paludibacteraceae bacterium]